MHGKARRESHPNTQEIEAGGSWVPGHPGLYSETLSQKTENKNEMAKEMLHIGLEFNTQILYITECCL